MTEEENDAARVGRMFSRAGEESFQWVMQQIRAQVPEMSEWIDSCIEDTDSEQAADTGVRGFSDVVRNVLTDESGGELFFCVVLYRARPSPLAG